ncbi:hypothetical protein, partial [Streptomyces sp. XY413]|uniref:hypothetical protein n=1 Tax=Streptomyces sp. XY413 TaxID=1519479 RepID=UPI00131ADE6E
MIGTNDATTGNTHAPQPAGTPGPAAGRGVAAAQNPADPAGGRTLGRGIVTGLWGRIEQQD